MIRLGVYKPRKVNPKLGDVIIELRNIVINLGGELNPELGVVVKLEGVNLELGDVRIN